MKIELLNAIYLIGMILLIAGFIWHFISTSKKKMFSENDKILLTPIKTKKPKTKKSIIWSGFQGHCICGYWFIKITYNDALHNLRLLMQSKGLNLYTKSIRPFIYLNEKNRVRKLQRMYNFNIPNELLYDSAG